MAKLCEGKVAIVTGGGRGLGREYCLMLAAEGASVVVNDLGGATSGGGRDHRAAQEVVDEIIAGGGNAIANGADVSDWEESRQMIGMAISTYGKLDILINNAGILRDRMLVSMSEADWDEIMKVHLKGTFAPSHHAANHWRERSKAEGCGVDGRLINTSSSSGLFGTVGQTNYGAAKAGIAAFTIVAAQELLRYGVTVNAIAPGAVTRLTSELGTMSDELRAKLDPRNVAPIVVWLASEQSAEVTGRVFEVMAGRVTIAEGWTKGPSADVPGSPTEVGEFMPGLVAQSRPSGRPPLSA